MPESRSSIWGGTHRGPPGRRAPPPPPPMGGGWMGPKSSLPQVEVREQNRSPRLFSSYRFKRSPFKELISDLSSLMFWDSRIQLVEVVA